MPEEVYNTVGKEAENLGVEAIPTVRLEQGNKPKIKLSKKIKILWYSDFLRHTGFGNVAENLIRRLLKTGNYEFEVVGINHDGRPYNFPASDYYDLKDVPVWPAFTPADGDMFGKRKIKDFIENRKYDIFFGFQDLFNLMDLSHHIEEVKKKRDIRYVVYFPVDGDLKKRWLDETLLKADYGLTYCPYGQEQIKKIYPNYEAKILPHGVDLESFHPLSDEDKKSAREQIFNITDDNTFIITNINRNTYRKDIPRMILAYKQFKEKYPEINSRLYLHCDPADRSGYDLPDLGLQYLPRHIAESIMFTDMSRYGYNGLPVPVLNKIYNGSDIITSSTRGEGWGLSTTEAMATKTPVVMPGNTATLNIVGKNEERGYLVDSGGKLDLLDIEIGTNIFRPMISIDSMVEKWKYVYDNREEANQKAFSAFEWIQQYTWDKVANKLDTFLQEVYSTIR